MLGGEAVQNFITDALFAVIPVLICLTIHELSHGAAAYALGDPTAKEMGRLTLNPLRHVDPIGFLMLLLVRFGWAKPVPVDMRNFARPRAYMALTALAGPASNFLLTALIFLFQIPIMRLFAGGGTGQIVAQTLFTTGVLSVYLGMFNLFPIPPLDGSKVLFSVLPRRYYHFILRYERYGMILLFALIWFGLTAGPVREAMDSVWQWIAQQMEAPSVFLFGEYVVGG